MNKLINWIDSLTDGDMMAIGAFSVLIVIAGGLSVYAIDQQIAQDIAVIKGHLQAGASK